MKLLTKEILKKLPPIGSLSNKKSEEIEIAVKFFCPWNNQWVWYGYEYDPKDKIFFGFVRGLENEFGTFSLAELEDLKGPYGLKIERDMHFGKHMVSEAIKERI